MSTIHATSSDSTATIGAMSPPSECPISPIAAGSTSSRDFRYSTPARTSLAKSADVALWKSPVLSPTPRSSTRSTAMPRRVRWSASTRNGRWPISSSSRFCGPEPVISSAAG